MKIINPSYEILTNIDSNKMLKDIELAARTCYKSEDKIADGTEIPLINTLISRGHTAMIEFADLTVKFICNRGFTHELVRHRLASYAQESTRYCNYSKDKFDNEITFIRPPFLAVENELNLKYRIWKDAMLDAETHYLDLINAGCKPDEARGVLPIDVKTEITIKTNLTEWRHIFKKRTPNSAHPSMQQLMRQLLDELKIKIPLIFDDITY